MSILGSIGSAALGSSTGLWLIGGGAAIAVAAIGAQTWRLHSEEADHAKDVATFAQREAELADRAAGAERQARAVEQQRAKDQEAISNAASQKIAAAEASASSAVAAAERVRDAAQALAARSRRAAGNPAPPRSGAPAGDPIGVLADVLGRADAAAGFMASLADQRGIRGEACERAYEALRP